MEPKGIFQLEMIKKEIIIIVEVSSFRFIWIPMLLFHDHYKYFNAFSAGTVFIHQTLTYKDGPRAERVNPPNYLNGIFTHLIQDEVQLG